MKLKSLTFLAILAFLYACNNADKRKETSESSSLKDSLPVLPEKEKPAAEVNYKTVQVGDLVWMAENLRVLTFRNGDSIPQAVSPEEWTEAGKKQLPVWCYYDNKPDGEVLYNWYAVNDPRGLAPEGFRLPSENDLKELIKEFGGEKKAGLKVKSANGWEDSGGGEGNSGFDLLPSGTRTYNGAFNNKGTHGYLWSTTEQRDFNAWHLAANSKNSIAKTYPSMKGAGFPVRCIKQ